ncbi:hypothetical protein DPEC_G00032970 [Dallia pectoralis]|uniref:Uncharacterized protein n=1 Tax=Dallia pectoralis TaxID=75939 RepID=A0ACC2HCQ9_DALPE|nr:hypothetical protein DPEC_G00032970 [Dallia pectoralis]
MSFSKDKAERKATFTRCVKRLSREDRCSFVCVPCDVRVPSFALIMTHVHTKHDALKLEKTFSVVCGSCQESHIDVPSFHTHYHSQHCPLDPCINSGGGGRIRSASSTGHKTLNAVKTTHSLENDDSDEGIKRGLALSEEEATGSGHVDLALHA